MELRVFNFNWIKISVIAILLLLLFLFLPLYYLYSFSNNTPQKYKTVNDSKGEILVIYNPLLNLIGKKNLEQIQQTFVDQNWNVTLTIPNKHAPKNYTDYNIVLVYLPFYFTNLDFLTTNYFNSLANINRIPFVLLNTNFSSENLKNILESKNLEYAQTAKIEINSDNIANLSTSLEAILRSADEMKMDRLLELTDKIKQVYATNNTLPSSIAGFSGYSDFRYTPSANYYKLCSKFSWNASKYPLKKHFNALHVNNSRFCYFIQPDFRDFYAEQISLVDNIRLEDFKKIENAITDYFNQNYSVPETLNILRQRDTSVNIDDPVFENSYAYTAVTSHTAKICTDFYKTPSLYTIEENLECKTLSFETSYLTNSTTLKNAGFDIRISDVNSGWIGQNTNHSNNIDDKHITLNPAVQSFYISDTVRATAGRNYSYGIYTKSDSSCNNCAIVGIKVYDINEINLSSRLRNCGTYDTTNQMVYNYLQPKNSDEFLLNSFTCTLVPESAFVRLVFGYIKAPDTAWSFDNAIFEQSN